jgi:hypothetical protein
MRSVTLVPKKLRWEHGTAYVNENSVFYGAENVLNEFKLSNYIGIEQSDKAYKSMEELMEHAQEIWDNHVMSLCEISIR